MSIVQNNLRFFGVLPKLPKIELTIRTPYRTLFANSNGFRGVTVNTMKGYITIMNRSNPPRVILMPPGEFIVQGIQPDCPNNHTTSESGKFLHTGGWLHVHENNSIEMNLLECCEKDQFNFEAIDNTTSEMDSPAGKIAAGLQEATFRKFMRRRAL